MSTVTSLTCSDAAYSIGAGKLSGDGRRLVLCSPAYSTFTRLSSSRLICYVALSRWDGYFGGDVAFGRGAERVRYASCFQIASGIRLVSKRR